MTYVTNIAAVEGHTEKGGRYPQDFWDRFYDLPVVDRWEFNGWEDSDFYIAVYDPLRDTFFQVQTWSTWFARPENLYDPLVNCTPELKAEYGRRLHRHIRRMRLKERHKKLLPLLEKLESLNLDLKAKLRLRKWFRTALNEDERYHVSKLFSTRLRSQFRKNIRDQIIAWANGESAYDTPLSSRQLDSICVDFNPYRR